MKYDIFISYRRDGGYETAKHLFDLLTRDGYTVSFDIDTLRNGDFDKTLLNRIDECTDFILVLDAHAFDRTLDPSFPKEKDWLYQELSYAMMKNKNIIPIMLSGFSFPDNLPDDIVKVQRKNGPKYDKYYFDEFYKKLKREFFDTPAPKINAINDKNTSGVFTLLISVDETSILFINDKKIRKIRQGTTASINTLKYGFKYKITLKNLANNKEEHIIEYEVPDKRESDEIKIEFKKMRDERKKIELEKRIENKRIKEQQDIIKQKLRLICDENYDWHDQIYHNTVRVKRNGKFGFLNLQGIEIVPCALFEAKNFEGDFAYVSNGNKWGVINQSGDLLINFICDKSSWITNGLSALHKNGKQTLINLYLPDKNLGTYNKIILTDDNDRFIVQNNGVFYLIDENGNCLGNNKFDKFKSIWHGIREGKTTIKFPLIVSQLSSTRTWLEAPNSQEKSLGLIDRNGKMQIPCAMQSIKPIVDIPIPILDYKRYYIVTDRSKFGLFDINLSNYSIPPIYKRLFLNYDDYDRNFYFIACDNNNKWGAVDFNNEEIIPFKYDDCRRIDRIWLVNSYNLKSITEEDFSRTLLQGGANAGFFKLLSDQRMKFLEKDEWPEFETEQYRDCIIDTFTYSNHHIVVSYPFVFFIDYFNLDDEVFYELIEPSTESYLDSINRIKDCYYQACRELYGEKEATRKLEKLLRCEKAKNDYYAKFDETRITLEKILQYAQDEKKQVVLSPDIRIICAESSDYAYRTLTEEINRIKETFKQNGFSCKSKEVHIVLLTDSIFRDNKTIEEVNRITTSPKNAIFIGSGLALDKNDTHQLKQWVENQTYYRYLLNIISDKETIALKLFALLNGWEGADSNGAWLWQSDDDEQV